MKLSKSSTEGQIWDLNSVEYMDCHNHTRNIVVISGAGGGVRSG